LNPDSISVSQPGTIDKKARSKAENEPVLFKQTDSVCSNKNLQSRESEESPPEPPTAAAVGGLADAVDYDGGGRKRTRANGTNPRAMGIDLRADRRPSRNGFIDMIYEEMEARLDAETTDAYPDGENVVAIPRRSHRH
jgi:hypothetical protein